MKKTALTLAALLGLSATGGAFAQSLEFSSLDADGDGVITLEELQVAIPDITPENFGLLDSDSDGVLSPDEFAILVPAEAPATDAPPVDAPLDAPLDAPIGDPLVDAPIQ